MNIGIIGSGNIGGTSAKLFVDAGHRVAIANSRGPESLRDLVASLGENAHAATVEDAARFGDVVLVAVPFRNYKDLPADALAGKIVLDANNYYPSRDGHFAELDNDSITSSEMTAQHLRASRVVKGFNTIWSEHLKAQGNTSLAPDDRRAIFIASDDAQAKAVVAQLIDSIGFAAFDTGSLAEGGRRQQVGATFYNKELTPKQAREL